MRRSKGKADAIWNKKGTLIIPFFLLVLSWVFYGNTLNNGYNLDDTLVTQNHPLTSQGVAAIPRIFKSPYYFDEAGYAFDYRPVVSSSFALEHSLFGERPLVSHAINVLLYGGTVILLFFLLRLFMTESGNRQLWLPGLVSLLFLIHPIHSEVVNSIKNRDELLALLFGLLASYIVVYGKRQPRSWAWYALGVGFFTLGLLAKLSGLLFAILIPVSLILFRQSNWKEIALLSLPLTAVSLLLLPTLTPFTLLLAGGGIFFTPLAVLLVQQLPVLSKYLNGTFSLSAGLVVTVGLVWLLTIQSVPAVTMVDQEPAVEALQTLKKTDDRAGRALEFSENPMPYLDQRKRMATSLNITSWYLQLLAWPAPLRFYYGYNMIPMADEMDSKPWMALLLLLSVVVLVLLAIPRDPWIAWGGLLLLFSLALFSNYIIPLPGIVGERFMYIGSLGFILIIVRVFEWGLRKWKLVGVINLQRIAAVLLLLLVVGAAIYVVQRNRHWKDALTLFRHDITHLAQSAKANQLLALELLKEVPATSDVQQQNRLLEEAAAYLQACVTIYPDFPYAYFDLGITLMKLGKYQEAQLATEKSATVDVYNPQVNFQLGMIHELKEEWGLAVDAYRAAIADEPNMLEAYLNLSTLFFQRGNFEEGLEVSFAALERWPSAVDLLTNIGNAYAGNNAYSEAAAFFVRALQQFSDNRDLIQKIIYCYNQMDRPDLAAPYLQMLQ